MNTITIEKAGTVETLTIPDDAIDAVIAELTERFGKRGGFVDGNKVYVCYGDGRIDEITYSNSYAEYAERGRVFHTEAEAKARDERDLAEQRLRKAYLAVTGGAEIAGSYFVPILINTKWTQYSYMGHYRHCHPYRFATAEQAAAFGRDNDSNLRLMMEI